MTNEVSDKYSKWNALENEKSSMQGETCVGIKSASAVVGVFHVDTQLVTVARHRAAFEEHFSGPVEVLFRSENEISAARRGRLPFTLRRMPARDLMIHLLKCFRRRTRVGIPCLTRQHKGVN